MGLVFGGAGQEIGRGKKNARREREKITPSEQQLGMDTRSGDKTHMDMQCFILTSTFSSIFACQRNIPQIFLDKSHEMFYLGQGCGKSTIGACVMGAARGEQKASRAICMHCVGGSPLHKCRMLIGYLPFLVPAPDFRVGGARQACSH